MVIFRTKFGSGFQMALAAISLKPFKNRTKKSGFQMNKQNGRHLKSGLDIFSLA
jgi:hypothetical protein